MGTNRRAEIESATSLSSINPAVPTDMHPDALLPHADVLVDSELTDSAAAAYDSSRRALKSLYESSDAINRAVDECKVATRVGTEKSTGKPIMSFGVDPSRAAPLASAMSESFARAALQVDASTEILNRAEEKLQSDVAIALTNKRANEVSVSTAAADIRRYVANLKVSGARMNFLDEAVQAGVLETVSAVLQSNNPFISGLTRAEADRLRDLASDRFAPRAYKQLGAVRAVKQHLQRVQKSYAQNYFDKLPRTAASPADAALAKLKG
jgi:type IV pilus biogenesis protein CpaD/CtpE